MSREQIAHDLAIQIVAKECNGEIRDFVDRYFVIYPEVKRFVDVRIDHEEP